MILIKRLFTQHKRFASAEDAERQDLHNPRAFITSAGVHTPDNGGEISHSVSPSLYPLSGDYAIELGIGSSTEVRYG